VACFNLNFMKHSRRFTLCFGRVNLSILALGLFATSANLAIGSVRYYLNDHLATTVGIADAAGEIAAIEADAFGSPFADGANLGRFTGKPYDEDLGAYVFPFRNYRADEARWMSVDPSGFPDGVNARYYASVPTANLDALGLYTVTITGGYGTGSSASFSYSVGTAQQEISGLPNGWIGGMKTTAISISNTAVSGFWVQDVVFSMNGSQYDRYFEAAKVSVGDNSISVNGKQGISLNPFVDQFIWNFQPPTSSGSATIQGWANYYVLDLPDSPSSYWPNNVGVAGDFYSTRSVPSWFSRSGAVYSWLKISWE
jgi:RHS repeat-associated protein